MSRLWVQMGIPRLQTFKVHHSVRRLFVYSRIAAGQRGPVSDRVEGYWSTGLRPVWIEIVREISSAHLTRATSTQNHSRLHPASPPVHCTLGKHHPAQKSDYNTTSTTSPTHTTTATATCAKPSQESHLAQKTVLSFINLSSVLSSFFKYTFIYCGMM